jgi:hypothetical protein
MLLLLLLNYIKATEAITFEDGDTLFRLVSDVIKSKRNIVIDFSEITFVTTPFLNAAFGQLHEHFTEDEINSHLKIVKLNESTQLLLDEVHLKSKEFYSNPESFTEIVDNIIYGI